MKHFICPRCYASQELKHLYFMSMNSTWRCPRCNILLKPKNLTGMSNYIGMVIVVIPANILLFFFKLSFLKTITIVCILGIFFYLFSLLYFYKTTIFEEA